MICPLYVSGEFCVQVIRTDINLYYAEYDYELDNYDLPKGLPKGHGTEALNIKGGYLFERIWHGSLCPWKGLCWRKTCPLVYEIVKRYRPQSFS